MVVIGLCKHGLYLTRNFARHGVPVHVIERDFAQPSAQGRHGRKIRCANLMGPELIDTLVELKRELPAPVALFPTNDRMIDILQQHRAELEDHYRLPFPAGDLVTRLKDKSTLHDLAERSGLNVPQSFVVDSEDALEALRSRLRFPLAAKPVLPMSSFKSIKCEAFEEVAAQVRRSAAIGEPLILQEWIDGDDRDILFGAYYIDKRGACLARFGGRKLLCYPPATGHATAAEGFDIGPLLDEGHAFLRDAGFWGLCSVEYKSGGGAQAKFIEVTVGRCDWWIMACELGGVNLPLVAYGDLVGVALPGVENAQRPGPAWHDLECTLPVLYEHLVSRQWSVGEVLRYVARSKRDSLLDWRDPGPFLAQLARLPRQLAQRLSRRLARTA
ncbi:MAG: hypothetical protein JNL85_18510 [Rubrivivax sp.]|nr:hypothetical protein [Rubrivivax sp.]